MILIRKVETRSTPGIAADARNRINSFFLLAMGVISLIGWLLSAIFGRSPVRTGQSVESVWGREPVLAYLVLTPSIGQALRDETALSEVERALINQIARQEQEAFELLFEESRPVVQNPHLTLEQKRQAMARMGYNRRVEAIFTNSKLAIQAVLGVSSYVMFVDWLEKRWKLEVAKHGLYAPQRSPRSYSVYATRYDSKGRYTVALPDKCVKFANGGSHICDSDGYSVGMGYSVFISYKSGVGVTVGESGPWNVDDNYWAKLGDPQPRRMFADLPLGMPEAQAAYFNGYNGGQDQFGRKVTAPYGIDLARQVSIDIGLQPGVNDWITVSFMWTDGWGGAGAPPAASGTPGTVAPTAVQIKPVETVTPQPDGSVVHIVQEGQALWSIAIAYGVTIQHIRDLNNLTASSVIFVGQKLLIKPPGSIPSATPTVPTPTMTITPRPSRTPSPTLAQGSPTWTLSPEENASQKDKSFSLTKINLFLAGIVLLVVGGIGLVIAGKLLQK